jgi:epoxide hydrolase-like predicted phosphatase
VKNSNAIHAVIWDLGGVLLRTHDHSHRERWEQKLGLAPRELERIVFGCDTSRQAFIGRAEVEDIWQAVADQLGVSEKDRAQLEQDFWSGDQIEYGLVSFIRKLRPAYKTGLISNAWNPLRSLMEEWEIADAFDHLTISAEIGIAKPDPRIYAHSLEALQVLPHQAIFVDDFKENIAAARQFGLHPVHFKDPEQAIAEVEELLSMQVETG